MIYIGIDPGASGGIGCVDDDGKALAAIAMPVTEQDVYMALVGMIGGRGDDQVRAMIERAQAFPKMGVVGAFNYGKGYGALLMSLTCAGFRFDVVAPRQWQGGLSCLTGGDKNVSKRRAQQLFPDRTITHAIADALLIAEFCRRRARGLSGVTSEGQPTGAADGKKGKKARTQQG